MKRGDIATFIQFDGSIVVGKIVFVLPNCYLVAAETQCTMYADGLYRFKRYETRTLR